MKKSKISKIDAKIFDKKFDEDEDISDFLDFDKAIVVKKIALDLPSWMFEKLNEEADKLNVPLNAMIKVWLHDRLSTSSLR